MVWKIQCKLPPKTKRFCPLKTFNNAPLKSLDRWGYYYFKSIIDGMQLSNIPVPFNTDLLERLNQGIYAKNIRDWSSEGLDGKKLQEYKDIKNCADAFNRVVDETTQQKENL